MSNHELEEGTQITLDFEKLRKVASCDHPVIPVVVQHADTKEVLIIAYVNETAFQYSREHQVAAFWSTSRNELWVKGATSGDTLKLREIRVNCEQNSLLYLVEPLGKGVCHTKDAGGKTRTTCYYRKLEGDSLSFVN